VGYAIITKLEPLEAYVEKIEKKNHIANHPKKLG
jgi:hypothetical protein